jgi:hypothetical protein
MKRKGKKKTPMRFETIYTLLFPSIENLELDHFYSDYTIVILSLTRYNEKIMKDKKILFKYNK